MSNYKSNLQTNNSALSANNIDLQSLIEQVDNLPEATNGVELPTLTNAGSAEDLLKDKQLIGQDGSIVTGTFTLDDVAEDQDELIADIITALDSKASGIIPTGTLEITENGTYNVTNYASAEVNVAASGIGSGSSGTEDGIIDRSITECSNDRVTSIGNGTFAQCSQLITASFPNVTNISNNAFYPCVKLTTALFPKATSIGNYAFRGCTKLAQIEFPLLKAIGTYAFYQCSTLTAVNFPFVQSITNNAFGACSKLKTADFLNATNIDSNAFYKCSVLNALILRNTNTVCTLSNANAFSSTPIASGTGYIYVPAALLADYQAATNFSTYAAQFRALESYTVDGTTTGALDATKI